MMAQSQALYTTGAITENIITNVKLVHRIGDTEVVLNPGDEIVVDDPFESYEVAVTYNFALPDGHSYGAGSTYEISIPDVFAVLPNPELNELKAADGTVFGTFIVTNDRKIMITFNENIENRSDISGFITLFSSFDSQYDGLAETEITIPIRDGSSITYPIKFMPSVNAIDKMVVYRIKPTMQRTLLGPLILIKALKKLKMQSLQMQQPLESMHSHPDRCMYSNFS